MVNKLLVLFLLIWITPPNTFARDPYPSTPRNKYIIPPKAAQGYFTSTDPQTMILTNGLRSGIISFSCFDPDSREDQLKRENRESYIYLTDPNIDNLQKATNACASHNPPYTVIKPPYLKNNKTTPECQGKEYDINCYDWPIGNFLGPHPKAGKGGFPWVTPIAYASSGGPLNACGPNNNELCDCQYVPKGPSETWIQITSPTKGRCVSPPYSTSGAWWTWYLIAMDNRKNQLNMNELTSVSIYFGIDGEGRPFKSGEGWTATPDPGFFSNYVPAVVKEVKKRYPGKTIRAHFTRDLEFFLENDLDFHWESLSSDGGYEYIYKDITYIGLDKIFQDYFTKTNTLGLNPDWFPYYQSMLNALSKHTDGVTGFPDTVLLNGIYQDGRGDFIKFAGSYIGRDINDTPGVWDNLRETTHPKEIEGNRSGKYGDYPFYLYRPEELENNHTVPVSTSELPAGTSQQIYNYRLPLKVWPNPDYNQYVGRKNAPGNLYISFDIDDGWRFVGKSNVSFTVRIVYLDVGNETFKFQYKDSSGNWREYPITKTDTDLWQEKTFEINNAYFNNNTSEGSNKDTYPTDFRIQTNGSVIHLVEVKGKEDISPNLSRPKAQVSCDIIQNEYDNPLNGIPSVGLNKDIKVKAVLKDQSGNLLPNERIMFTYNSEWNYAYSQKTNSQGTAVYNLNTANKINRSGFIGNLGYRPDKPSKYSVQVYYPGSARFQPSRNDCLLLVTNSTGINDANNTRIKITDFSNSSISYQVLSQSGSVIATKTETVGKAKYFNPEDPNAQTINILWYDPNKMLYASFNNFTLNFGPSLPIFSPQISLNKGTNLITLPRPAYQIDTSALPYSCQKISTLQNGFFKTPVDLTEGKKYYLSCSQNTTW